MPQLHELLNRVDQVAATNAAVLLVGERGTGKEAIARMLHALSPRAGSPFVVAKMADRTTEELERELFGDEDTPGRLSSVPGASLLLTDIEGLDPSLQSGIARSFSLRTSSCDVRLFVDVVPGEPSEAPPLVGALRDDFGALVIDVPPLRERIDDVPVMVEHLVDHSNRRWGARADAGELIASFGSYEWPGNLAELEHRVDQFVRASEAPPAPKPRRTTSRCPSRNSRPPSPCRTARATRWSCRSRRDSAWKRSSSRPRHSYQRWRTARSAIYARTALACISVSEPGDAEAAELAQGVSPIRVQLRSGGVVEGALHYVPVEGRARVTNLLNEPAPSFAVRSDGRLHYVAKAHVLYVEER